jgi:putative phosphonate metabolism protein
MTRYAIYFAPQETSPLWRFGSGVIGYDAAAGRNVPFTETAGLDRDAWSALTEEPRRYGFHATLKAPFELSTEADAASFSSEVARLAATLAPVTLAGLEVAMIGRFVALVPTEPSPDLQGLAAAAVERLDHLRRPLSDADRARRLKSPLTPRQLHYVDRYGYPYVREEFRFHMTLTGPIADEAERARVCSWLAAAHRAAVPAGPVAIDALAAFRQDRRDGRFCVISRFPLLARRAS